MTRPWQGEEGFTAGLESLVFGVLVFVIGTLVVVNAWAVVDARFATAGAAREAVRAVVEAGEDVDGEVALLARAQSAADQSFVAHGYATPPALVDTALDRRRCATVSVTVEVEVVPALLPGLAVTPSYTVRSSYAEVVDPFRSGLVGEGVGDCGF